MPLKTLDKTRTEAEVLRHLKDGMTIGIGGWGSRRKPMSLVRAIARSGLKGLTIVSYGGPDLGLLCKTGKVQKAVYGFCSLDSTPLEPHFRKARQQGALKIEEYDEGMLQLGLRAAGWRVPFLPTRAGLGSDVGKLAPQLRTVRSPYPDGEELMAMPALPLDVALVHMNRADEAGNALCFGPDPFFDDLFCMAAKQCFVSTEKLISTRELTETSPRGSQLLSRLFVSGVVEAPLGAHFTDCAGDYGRDESFQREYAATAKDEDQWQRFQERYVQVDHNTYRKNVEARS